MENIKIAGKITSWSLEDSEPMSDLKEVIIPTDIELPDDSPARVKILRAEGKKWYLTVTYHVDTEQPFALFVKTNNHEQTAQTSDAIERFWNLAQRKGIHADHIDSTICKCEKDSNVGKLTRAISLLLRHGVLIQSVVAELDKMEDIFVGSFLFQLKKFLSSYIKDGQESDQSCSECGGTMVFSEGCLCCSSCGNSKCG